MERFWHQKVKILLFQPFASREKLWGKYSAEGGFIPPIGLLSIAGFLASKGYCVKIIDPLTFNQSEEAIRGFLIEEKFDLIGISSMTNTILDTYYTARFCKKILPKTKIVVGGIHATVLPVKTMEECSEIDFLVVGEGELTMEELTKNLKIGKPKIEQIKGLVYRDNKGKIIQNKNRELILDLDVLPLPAYHLLDMSKYVPHPTQYKVLPSYSVIAQRGCPFDCAFCSVHCVHGKKVRSKSVSYLISEIEILIEKFKAKGIHFQDSTFTVNRDYVVKFCEEIIRKKLFFKWDINTRVDCVDSQLLSLMKKAGLWMINFGLESGSQQSLDLLRKGIILSQTEKAIIMTRKIGIVTCSTWILGLPKEDEPMVKRTIQFSKKVGTELALFFFPIPYPKTDLELICKNLGGLRNDVEWKDYSAVDYFNPVYVNPLLGKKKMQNLIKYAYLSYYLSPKIIWRNIQTIDSLADVVRYWRAFHAWFNSLF